MRKVVDYTKLGHVLSQIDWSLCFNNCANFDYYAAKFNDTLLRALSNCTHHKPIYKRRRLPKHVVRLLHIKKVRWQEAKRSGDYAIYKAARTTARAAIRRHRRNVESRLIHNNDRKAFFSYINRKKKSPDSQICLIINDTAVTDHEAAEAFLVEFAKNFSSSSGAMRQFYSACTDVNHSFKPTCNERIILETLNACSNSDSSPDGISYRVLKSISQYISHPLTIIFRLSISTGVFPKVWKHAVVLPLYKGKGDRTVATSYRPISLCSCIIGKLLEKIMQTQLMDYLERNNKLCKHQHGFSRGRLTVTNTLACAATIAEVMLARHAYDQLSFDFKAAFDKVPHRYVIKALAGTGITGTALNWFNSFLSRRSQSVKVNKSFSSVCDVVSGVIQGSACGTVLYAVVADSLLRRLKLPAWAFADDLKLLADVAAHSHDVIQLDVDTINQWSDERSMLLSIEKCAVMHCGKNQRLHSYVIKGKPLMCVDSFKDLGLVRTSNSSYSTYCEMTAARVNRAAGAVRRAFQLKAP